MTPTIDIASKVAQSPQPALTLSESIKQSLIDNQVDLPEKVENNNNLLDFKTPKQDGTFNYS